MMKKDISTNLLQKCLILCSNILLKVRHNLSLKVLLPWQHTGFQTSPILLKSISVHLQRSIFHIYKWCLVYMTLQQACKFVSSSLWPCLGFFELKITNILKSSGWGLEQSGLPWEQNFIATGVYPIELLACQVLILPWNSM